MRVCLLLITSLTFACAPKSTDTTSTPSTELPDEEAEPLPGASEGQADRPQMTAEACEDAGGTVVGDIGDGAVHRPSYRCENGNAPIGRVDSGIEGAVCCPAGQA